MSADATLAAIDGALADWDTSGDAMRWNPDPGLDRVICDGGAPLWPEPCHPIYVTYGRGSALPATIQRQMDAIAGAISASLPDGLRFEWGNSEPSPPRNPAAAVAEVAQGLAAVGAAILAEAGRTINTFAAPFVKMAHQNDGRLHPRAHIRCRVCNPAGNPLPLAVDGAAYRRRQRARRRRGR